jgi:tetratricopeptide (TPR) repeat protein
LLHTDALLRTSEQGPSRRAGGGPQRVRFDDGQQRGAEEAPGQLELARALLDNVTPDPERDETVRLWYTAIAAHGQYHQRHTREEDRAVRLFPQDADLLLLAGAFHESLASPRMQSLASSTRLPDGGSLGIGDARAELREAEKLLRRAVASRPSFDEARIRLGRVLYRLGRTEQAARELQQARSALSKGGEQAGADGGLLLYYAEMFLGAASEALGRFDAAKTAYARASALYPQAPSPRLALSQLALRGQDRTRALAAVQVALRPSASGDDADPWWRYHVIQGRGSDAWFAQLYRSVTAAP